MAMTKSDLVSELSEKAGVSKREAGSILDGLTSIIEREISRGGGTFTLPGLLKIKTVQKPARPARTMISPFNGQQISVAAKPASTGVKIQALSGLKRMVG